MPLSVVTRDAADGSSSVIGLAGCDGMNRRKKRRFLRKWLLEIGVRRDTVFSSDPLRLVCYKDLKKFLR